VLMALALAPRRFWKGAGAAPAGGQARPAKDRGADGAHRRSS